MNLGTKLGYWTQHTQNILRHDDESVGVRKAFLAKMREILETEETAMEARDAARVELLMQDAVHPNDAASAQEVPMSPEAEAETAE